MEKKLNITDLTQVSKKTLDASKRIEEQSNSFIKQHDDKVRAEKALLEKKKHEEVLNNARFSQGSIYSKNKARVKAMSEAISYTDRASKAAIADILSTIVENALLLDTAEYSKLNPGYKTTIKETVLSFLENGNIVDLVQNKKTLALMEYVAGALPNVKTGVFLKEEEIIDIVKKSTPAEINNMISSLTGDVKERVASIVVKEQDEAKEVQDDVNQVMASSEGAKDEKLKELGYSPEEIEAAKQQAAAAQAPAEGAPQAGMEQLPPEGAQQPGMEQLPPDAAQQAGGEGMPADAGAGIPPEFLAQLEQMGISQTPDGQFVGPDGQPIPPEALEQALAEFQAAQAGGQPQAAGEDPYADDEYLDYQQGQATPGFSAGSAPQQSTVVPQTANKNTAVEVSPDGTVKVNIVRENFYREVPRQGILESLALNEAKEMVAAGKPYNGDLALANALLQLTILETFNTTGLIPISESDYGSMLNLPAKKKKKTIKEELGEVAAEPVATSDAPAKEETPSIDNKDVFPADEHKQVEEVKEVIVEAELGSAAAKPVATSEKSADIKNPDLKNSSVYTSDKHMQAEEVEEVIVESWKQKVLKALGK